MKLVCEFLTLAVCDPSVSTGLPAAVSATDLQFALQSLEGVGRVSVIREGTCAGFSWNIKWRSSCGKQNLLQVPRVVLVSVFFYVLHAYLYPGSFQKELETMYVFLNANSRLNIKERKLRRLF